DMRPIGSDLLDAGAGQQPSLRARMAWSGGNVVGIEEEGELGVEYLIGPQMRHQQELLEKPGGIRAMPTGRTWIGHGLDDLVCGRQAGGTPLGFAAHAAKRIAPTRSLVGGGCRRVGNRLSANGRPTHVRLQGVKHRRQTNLSHATYQANPASVSHPL